MRNAYHWFSENYIHMEPNNRKYQTNLKQKKENNASLSTLSTGYYKKPHPVHTNYIGWVLSYT